MLNTVDAKTIILKMKSILCSSLSTEIINATKVYYKELLSINNSGNSKVIDAIYSKLQVNSDGTINAHNITIEDIKLLNNIIENNTSLLITTKAKNLLELIYIYTKL